MKLAHLFTGPLFCCQHQGTSSCTKESRPECSKIFNNFWWFRNGCMLHVMLLVFTKSISNLLLRFKKITKNFFQWTPTIADSNAFLGSPTTPGNRDSTCESQKFLHEWWYIILTGGWYIVYRYYLFHVSWRCWNMPVSVQSLFVAGVCRHK